MKTELIKIDSNHINIDMIKKASHYLNKGKLVAFPTETVYGLGANALDLEAFKQIFIAKGRPSDNPLIVHVATIEQILRYVKEIPKTARILANHFWPGPMTLIFESNGIIPKEVYGNLDKIGFRIPNHPIAFALLKESDLPICAPSANLSGSPSPTSAKHVLDDLNEKIDLIIDGGECKYGVESTVIDISNEDITILRPGAITLEMVKELFPNVKLMEHLNETSNETPVLTPGLKYKHYSPKAKVILVTGKNKEFKIKNYIDTSHINNYLILGAKENQKFYKDLNFKEFGSKDHLESFAHNLFKLLRSADDNSVEYLFIEEIDIDEIGLAVMNRLLRAKSEII